MNDDALVVGQSDYANQTMVHPIGLAAVIILGLCVLFLPRRWAVLPLIVMACFISSAQRIVIAGLDFDFLRIMVSFGVVRLVLWREYINYKCISLDIMLVCWVISSTFFYILREGTSTAIVNRLGFSFNVCGMYFLFRCLIQNWRDVELIIGQCVFLGIPVAIFFILEHQTGRNMFSVFGGVPVMTAVREGKLRCQGAFSHPILAGCYWVSLVPLFAALWWKSNNDRIWAVIGVSCSLVVVFCCASSTPVMGFIVSIVGGLLFFLRYHMRLVRWVAFITLVALHMVMNAPVWHLISRVSAVGGSTGWHRFNLINQAIINFDDWWFYGCAGQTIESWGIWAGDVTNQYLLEGVWGGFVTLLLFILIIIIAFRQVGRLWRRQSRNSYQLALPWALGVSLFVHCMNFIGVAYFGQTWTLWYLLLAIIGSLSVQNASTVNMRK